MLNAVTVDVEEWFDTVLFDGRPAGAVSRLEENVADILELLGKRSVKATFFILGSVAREHPAAVKAIAAAGHEVASHGDTHCSLCRLTPEEFRAGLRASMTELESLAGARPLGYRAPTFSVLGGDAEFLSEVKAAGYFYDSSLYPLPFTGRSRGPRAGTGAREFPPSVTTSLRLPFLGGSFLRLLPYRTVAGKLAELNRSGLPGMLYFHTWEFEKARPAGAGLIAAAGQFLNSRSVPAKVDALLSSFAFVPARRVLGL